LLENPAVNGFFPIQKVKTAINGHKTADIEILQNKNSKCAKLVEGVVPELLKRWRPF
jgi:hypothetical protein